MRSLVVLFVIAVVGPGCGDDARFDAGPDDGGRDGAMDAAMPPDDAGRDAGFDAAMMMEDAGEDAGVDAGEDAGVDAGLDAGSDAGFDAGLDAGSDAGPPDAGVDARSDAGSACLALGDPCTPDRGCRVGGCTFAEAMVTLGGTGDAILGHPTGATSIPYTVWEDGYCTPAEPTASMPAPCVLGEADGACGPCGTCVGAGTTAAGEQVTVCLLACTPTLTDNDLCRDDYECNFGLRACLPGCPSDDFCRIYREDTNGDGTVDNGPLGDPVGVDRLRYDTASTGTCSASTFRCTHPGTVGAEAGDTCVRDSQCEANGSCIAPDAATWAGGYCTKFGCDVPGNPCAGAGRCQERRIGVPICVETCTVAGGRGTTPAEWIVDRGGCRAGYQCAWNGVGAALVAGNGACLPGIFNAITVSNVGAACTMDSSCYSPFGYGLCADSGVGGFCTVLDCGAPGVPAGVCGAGASCVDADGATGDLTLCMENCMVDTDCAPGLTCMDHDAMPATPRVCFATL